MGDKASATPDLLHAYSLSTTSACGELANWVRGELAASIADYRAGAIDYGRTVLYGYGAIDTLVSRLLTDVWTTDKTVDHVATLFRAAGGNGDLPKDGLSPLLDSTLLGMLGGPFSDAIVTTDDALDNAGYALGSRIGSRTSANGPLSLADILSYPAYKEFLDDPDFYAGLLNKIAENQKGIRPPDQFGSLVWDAPTIKAVVLAFKSGNITEDAKARLIWSILDDNNRGVVPTELFKALTADPPAAANFVAFLQQNPEKFALFLAGKGWGEGYPGFHPPGSQAEFINGFLKVLIATLPTMSPDQVAALMGQVGELMPGSRLNDLLPAVPPDTLLAIEPTLLEFVKLAANKALPALPPQGTLTKEEYGKELAKWASHYSIALTSFDKVLDWVYENYEDTQQLNTIMRRITENFALGVTGFGLLFKVKSFPLALLGNGSWGATGGELQAHIDKFLTENLGLPTSPDGPTIDPKANLRGTALLGMILELYSKERPLIGPDGPVTFKQLLNEPNFAKLLDGSYTRDNAASDWATDLTFKDTGVSLKAIVNEYQVTHRN